MCLCVWRLVAFFPSPPSSPSSPFPSFALGRSGGGGNLASWYSGCFCLGRYESSCARSRGSGLGARIQSARPQAA